MNQILASFCHAPPEAKSGIYLFVSLDDKEVYYVGRSTNILKRYKTHSVKYFLKFKEIDYKLIWRELSEDELDPLEFAYIRAIKPTLNTVFNTGFQSSLKLEYAKFINERFLNTALALQLKISFDAEAFDTVRDSYYLAHTSIEAIASLNEAGKVLLRIQEKFKEAKASGGGMIETDLGEFKNFDDYLIRGSSVKKTQAYDYIKLAKNWDVVLALGMQDTTCSKTLAKSMRLCRTLKIISWYKECKKRGRPESELTLEQYWIDEEARILAAREARQIAEAELALLRVQVETTDVVPAHVYEQVSKAYQEKAAKLEELSQENRRLREELEQLKPKPSYKFTPPVFA